ncbi:MAG: diheme cytochrome c [Proteobacteria bacterium]|nr:diheme cytochrome c [Pseudomonadota bacterium]
MRRISIAAAAAAVLLATGGLAWADRHHQRGAASSASVDPIYLKECGSCHMAFQPQFLPVRSWQAVMNDLADHFGENASLGETTRQAILTYLQANAGDAPGSNTRLLRGLASSKTPLRITETPYWVREHQKEVRPSAFLDPKVKSKANCIACHVNAQQGIYEGD